MKKISMLVLATAMVGLTGCMTMPGYSYRGGTGDYYYGYPSVDYDRYGSVYGYSGYGSPYRYSRYGYSYGSPYGYGNSWSLRYGLSYGYPGYGYGYYPRYAYYYSPHYRYYPHRWDSDRDDEYREDREGYHLAQPMGGNYSGQGQARALGNYRVGDVRAASNDSTVPRPARVYRSNNDTPVQARPERTSSNNDSSNSRPRAARMQRANRMQKILRNERDQKEP